MGQLLRTQITSSHMGHANNGILGFPYASMKIGENWISMVHKTEWRWVAAWNRRPHSNIGLLWKMVASYVNVIGGKVAKRKKKKGRSEYGLSPLNVSVSS